MRKAYLFVESLLMQLAFMHALNCYAWSGSLCLTTDLLCFIGANCVMKYLCLFIKGALCLYNSGDQIVKAWLCMCMRNVSSEAIV